MRGIYNYHWKTEIDPYMAHAGSGDIKVFNGTSAETNSDSWDGVLVRPVINFIDQNYLHAGSKIVSCRMANDICDSLYSTSD